MPDTGTLEYWSYGGVPVIVNTDNIDLGSLEYWSYGGVPVIYQQTSTLPIINVPLLSVDVTPQLPEIQYGITIGSSVATVNISPQLPEIQYGVTITATPITISITPVNPQVGIVSYATLTIVDGDGVGIEGATIKFYDSGGTLWKTATTDINGQVTTDIINDTYTIIVEKQGMQDYDVKFTIDSNIDWVVRLYKQNKLIMHSMGTAVNLKPKEPTNTIYM